MMSSSASDGVISEVVNPRTGRDLELGKVLDGVAAFAASTLGAEVVRALSPRSDRAALEREFGLVGEMEEAIRAGFSLGESTTSPRSSPRPAITGPCPRTGF